MTNVRKHRLGIFWLPSLITSCSMMAAIIAITLAMQGRFTTACLLLAVAAMLDVLDGLVARLTNSASDFGAQLDSLADMLAFGVAPALLSWLWAAQYLGDTMTAAAGLFTIMAALRLARFNVQLGDKEKKSYFQGLPSPAAATMVFSLIWLAETLTIDAQVVSMALAFSCLFAGLLMVSNIRYLGIKHVRARTSFLSLLLMVIALVIMSIQPPLMLFLVIWGYAIFGIVYTLYLRRQRRNQKKFKTSSSPIV